MHNFFLLIKNYINVFIGGFNNRKNKKSYLSGLMLLLIIGALFVMMFSSTAYITISEIKKDPETDIEVALYALSAIGLVFLLLITIMKATNNKKVNDFELLYSLPIKKITIVAAKIFKETLFDFLALFLVMMPGYVIYAFISGASFSYPVILTGFLVIFLITLFSTGISILLKELLTKTTSHFKNAEIIQTIINVIVMIAFIVFYYIFMNNIQVANMATISAIIDFYPIKLMVDTLTLSNIVSVLILLAICLGVFLIAIFITSYFIDKKSKVYVNTDKTLNYNKNNIINGLLKREASKYFRSTNYVINTIIGGFFAVLFGAIVLFIGTDPIKSAIELNMGEVGKIFASGLDVLVMLISILLSSSVIITSCSISMEGKEFWILKSSPIRIKDIFYSKLLLNIIISLIPSLISVILISIRVGIIYMPILIGIAILGVLFGSLNGLNLNLKYPKLNWKDDVEVIKQSMAVMMSMVTSIIPGIVFIIGYFILMNLIPPYLYLIIIFIIYLIIDIIEYRILMTKGVKRFENLYN